MFDYRAHYESQSSVDFLRFMEFVIVVFRLFGEWRLGMGFRVNLEGVIITFNHRFSEKYSLDLRRQQMLKTESL